LGEIRGIYIDDNVSGAGFERKGIDELTRDVTRGEIDLLIIKDLSRLGRNNAKTLLFLDFLEEKGVRVITYDGRYDSIRDNDTVGIDTWYNERYIRDISRKIRTNLRFKIQKGEYIGSAPYGYEKSQYEKNKLVVNKEQAEIVKKIYSLYKEGFGYSYIAGKLNQEGIKSPSMGLWNAVAVMRILGNRVYIGDTVQGVSEKISFKSKKTRRLPQSCWVITEKTHEPIISREEFNEIQRIRAEKRNRPGPHKGFFHVFRGMMFCGACGSIMFARKRQGRPMSYICSSYGKNGKSVCTSHHIRETDLCSIVLNDLEEFLKDNEAADQILKKLLEEEGIKDWKTAYKRLQKQLEAKQRQQEILYQDRLEEKISESLFLRMNQQLESKMASIKKEMEILEGKKDESCNTGEMIQQLKDSLKINGINNEIAKIMINRIVVFDKGDVYDELMWNLGLTEKEKEYIKHYGAVFIEYNF